MESRNAVGGQSEKAGERSKMHECVRHRPKMVVFVLIVDVSPP